MTRRAADLPPLRRVGHKGADLLAPGNTVDSFQAALAKGVDMIEFDVLRTRDGRLVLAHDPADAARREPLTLEEGLDLFAGGAYADVDIDVDMKVPGYEREVVEGLRERGLGERALVTSMYLESLDLVRELAPELRRGWSVPRVRRDYTKSALAPGAYLLALGARRILPGVVARYVRGGRIQAVMSHFLLVSGRLVERVRAEGGEVYVWTVDDAQRIERLEALGVDGVITNDPGLFAAPPEGQPA